MEPDFWHERWKRAMLGFHLAHVNPHIQRHIGQLGLARGERIFVPLCGKSLDLVWLAEQGFDVCGVELSPIAARAAFEEAGLEYRAVSEPEGFTTFEGGDLRILAGDFFSLPAACLAGTRAVYDRAALIALPPAMRGRYVRRMSGLLPDAPPVLLVTLEYDQSQMNGPPFSVLEGEVRAHWSERYEVDLLEDDDVLERERKFAERGLTALREKVFVLAPRGRG